MKKVIKHSKKVFLMVAMIATVMGYANETSFYINNSDDNLTILTLDNVEQGNLFTIKDENNTTIYKELIKEQGIYRKGFDFTSLNDGNYFFELDKDVEISVIPFIVKYNVVTFNKEAAKTIFKPVSIVKEDKVFVTKLSLNKAPLKIEIFFAGDFTSDDYELVHAETIKDTKYIQRIFKLISLDEGKYKIVYHTEGRDFVKIVE